MSVTSDIRQQPKKLCQAPANELTPEEIAWVYSMYYGCPIGSEGKLILNQMQHMSDKNICLLCYWVDSMPFARVKPDKWCLERGYDTIGVRGDIYAYHIDIDTGNVHVYLDGRLTTTANNGYAMQFHVKHYNAFALFFDKGHWANGMNAFQLGLAVPNRKPLEEALLKLYDNDTSLVNQYFADKLYYGIDLNNVDFYNSELTEINKQLARIG